MDYFLAAIPAIISGCAVPLLIWIVKQLLKMQKDSEHDRKMTHNCYMWTLRSVVWSPEFSFEEKTKAFKEYEANGGNGDTKAKYEVEKKRHEEEVQELIRKTTI